MIGLRLLLARRPGEAVPCLRPASQLLITENCLPGIYYSCQIESVNLANLVLTHRWMLITDAAERKTIEGEMATNSEKVLKLFKQYETSITEPEDRHLYTEMVAARGPYTEARKTLMTAAADRRMAIFKAELDPAYDNYRHAIQALADYNKADGDDAGSLIVQAVSFAKDGILIFLAVAIAVGVVVAFIIITGTNKILRSVVSSLETGSAEIAAATT